MLVISRLGKTGRAKFLTALLPLLLFLPVLGGCSMERKEEGTVAFWVAAGTNRGESFSRNSLGGYDTAGKSAVKARLPQYHISGLTLDSRGRLWLGQAWNDAKSSNLLLLWEKGELARKIEVGMQPEAGIVQFNEEMIAGCTEAGMGFSLWSVALENLESKKVVAVDREQRDFLFLTTIAASEDYLIAAAIHDAPGSPDSSHTSIWWYDRDFTLLGNTYLGADTAVWSMVPMADGNFLLLNNSGFVRNQPDLLVFDPRAGAIIKEIRGSGYAFRGTAAAGKIYVLNRIWSSTRINAERSVTIVAGDSVTTIPLPDNFGAEDIAAANGTIYLAAWQRGKNSGDGIYRLDPATAKLEQIIEHPDASSILVVPQN